ncbi:MAG TPA: YaeQ family protein [Gemmatimonadaceae bacterium]|nr:YaeQ family protein [Gemmatimonadaceae bacterium]
MALTATLYNFEIELSHVDRNVYETIAFKAAQQPSETDDYLIARVLAYALEYAEGIGFSGGIAEADQPAIFVRDLTGALRAWIDIGSPDAARLHKASKAAPRVAVYTHKDPRLLVRALSGERIHRAEALELYAIDRELIAALVERLDRRMRLQLSVTDRHLFVTIGGETFSGAVEVIGIAE